VCVTEEEISNMRRELDKYGIQMPAFSKIGGMLANEVCSVDLRSLCVCWLFHLLYLTVFVCLLGPFHTGKLLESFFRKSLSK